MMDVEDWVGQYPDLVADTRLPRYDEFVSIPEVTPDEVQAPYLCIIRQPAEKYRFRYESEGQNVHQLLLSENGSKSYPTVKLYNYKRPAWIRCLACRTEEESYKIHCHSYKIKVRGDNYRVDPVYLEATQENDFTVAFKGGIIFTKKQEVKRMITRKVEEINAYHITQKVNLKTDDFKNIDTNKVVLRFDAYGEGFVPICEPVFSKPILNKKSASTGDLKIDRMNQISGSCRGYEDIFLLVEKVTKEVKVRFFDDESNWEAYGFFNGNDIHHQYAIVLKTPPYRDIDTPVKVKIELVRGEERSEPRNFIYLPHVDVDDNLNHIYDSDTE